MHVTYRARPVAAQRRGGCFTGVHKGLVGNTLVTSVLVRVSHVHTHPHSNIYTAYNCKSHFNKATTLSCVRVRTCAAKTRELMAFQSRQQGLQTLPVTLSDRRGAGTPSLEGNKQCHENLFTSSS